MCAKFLIGFSTNVKGDRPSETIVQKYIKQGSKYLSEFTPFNCTPLGVEKKMVFQIDGIPFVGYADYIGEKDGLIYVIDTKSKDLHKRSGRKKKTKNDEEIDNTLVQLYLYSAAIEQEYGQLPSKLCINCFRTGTFIEENFDIEAYEHAISWAKDSIENIKNADDFNPDVDFFKCKYICGVSGECCYWNMR